MNEVLLQLIGEGAPQPPSCADLFLPMILFGFALFIMTNPARKQAKARREMLSKLTKGNRVVTSGGLLGKIISMNDHEVTLEIADKVRVRVLKEEVELYTPPPSAGASSDR